ncbi:MAG: antitoxin VapB family protein [Candidatus Thermoplasmatota archaeon]|jgi:predicted CopG family antitoxin|nr:antitoxin VapB family protein [Candidatus Thermoplasmatota archaeon]
MTKPVTLSDAAYDALSKAKGKDMSFSDTVLKLVEASKRKNNFSRFAGALKSDASNLEKFRGQIEEDRVRNTEGL